MKDRYQYTEMSLNFLINEPLKSCFFQKRKKIDCNKNLSILSFLEYTLKLRQKLKKKEVFYEKQTVTKVKFND